MFDQLLAVESKIQGNFKFDYRFWYRLLANPTCVPMILPIAVECVLDVRGRGKGIIFPSRLSPECLSLGEKGYLTSRYIEITLRFFKQCVQQVSGRHMLITFKKYPPR